jgi:hypothetical protein
MVRKLQKILIGVVLLCCTLVAFLFWLADPLNLTAPSDQKLIASFQDHHEAFEKLRQMATEDLQQVSHISMSHVEGKISEARKKEYKAVLSDIYPCQRVTVNYDASVRYICAGGGLSAISSGWMKGIEYLPGDYRNKGNIVQSLDNAHTLRPDVYLRQIEPKWFIVYQRTDN